MVARAQNELSVINSEETNVLVGSLVSWRRGADHIRTVELVAQVIVKQTGRNHQWHILVGQLTRPKAKQTFVTQNDKVTFTR